MKCWFYHTWYIPFLQIKPGSYTCATYNKTGLLPDEDSYNHFYGWGMYRLERSCMNCDHAEYWNKKLKKWVAIKRGNTSVK